MMSSTALACDFHLPWNLVDSKNKIDWDGKTKYSNEWEKAIQNWNAIGVVKIQEDSISVLQDLNVGDYYDIEDRR